MSTRNLSLAQHLSAGQLPMFMTAPEIKEHFYPDDSEYQDHEDTHNVWDRKLKESKTKSPNEVRSRYQTFKKEGVKNPIELGSVGGEPKIYNGHHRVASMEKIDPNRLLPVEFHQEYMNRA